MDVELQILKHLARACLQITESICMTKQINLITLTQELELVAGF